VDGSIDALEPAASYKSARQAVLEQTFDQLITLIRQR
jgi:hypothetical protein